MDAAASIREYIQQLQAQRGGPVLTAETPLIEGGYLDSLGALELVLFLEERFSIQIDPEEVNEREFRSVSTVAALVQRKRTAHPAVEQA